MIRVADLESGYRVWQWNFVFEYFDLFGEFRKKELLSSSFHVDSSLNYKRKLLLLCTKASATNLMIVSIAIQNVVDSLAFRCIFLR